MKLFKLIVITLCVMLVVSACGGRGGVSDEGVVDVSSVPDVTTAAEVIAIPETTTTEETTTPPYRNTTRHYDVVVELHGETYIVPFQYNILSMSEEQLHLAQRAVDLLIDLENDYYNTVKQIRFEPYENLGSDFPYREFVEEKFNREVGMESISLRFASIGLSQNGKIGVIIPILYPESERLDFIGVLFVEENDEWFVSSIYPSF